MNDRRDEHVLGGFGRGASSDSLPVPRLVLCLDRKFSALLEGKDVPSACVPQTLNLAIVSVCNAVSINVDVALMQPLLEN